MYSCLHKLHHRAWRQPVPVSSASRDFAWDACCMGPRLLQTCHAASVTQVMHHEVVMQWVVQPCDAMLGGGWGGYVQRRHCEPPQRWHCHIASHSLTQFDHEPTLHVLLRCNLALSCTPCSDLLITHLPAALLHSSVAARFNINPGDVLKYNPTLQQQIVNRVIKIGTKVTVRTCPTGARPPYSRPTGERLPGCSFVASLVSTST